VSEFQDVGLVMGVYQSLPSGGQWLYALDRAVLDYSHVISAWGGFDTASFRLVGPTVNIEEWLETGVGRHIQIRTAEQALAWEGFVNQVELQQGALTYTVGPLTDLANRVLCVYDALNTAYVPPTQEGRRTTVLVNDTDSQARYGIWEKEVSAGLTTATVAASVRDTFLAERRYPARTQAVGNSGASSVTVSLAGYHNWLGAYTYAQSATSGTVSATALIQAILAADTNAIFSTDYTRLDTNALLVPAYEADNTGADAKLKEVVTLGDAASGRWNFGIYENRQAVYTAAQTTGNPSYVQSMQGSNQDVTLFSGARIWPWLVRPAQWIFMNDFLVGKPVSTTLGSLLATDLRCAFVEQVTYTAPYSLSWSGGRLSRLDQILAQVTMGGML
jgi:hypothetical protein